MIDKSADSSQHSIDFSTGEAADEEQESEQDDSRLPELNDPLPPGTDQGEASSEDPLEAALDQLEQQASRLREQILAETRALMHRTLDETLERLREELRETIDRQLEEAVPGAVDRAMGRRPPAADDNDDPRRDG